MRYLELAENTKGRDFILGDLHGCYTILKKLLKEAHFNPGVDRLILVGDLIDRGPESEKCLQLLLEPWCHAVRGNHEEMFCDAVDRNVTWQTIQEYWSEKCGGGWTREWFERHAPELMFWSSVIKELPYVIHVQGARPFWVVHAELWSTTQDITESNVRQIVESSNDKQRVIFQWSRMLSNENTIGRRTTLPGPIYCGHTPTMAPGHERMGHCNIDGGAGVGTRAIEKGFRNPCLFLYCHTTGQSFRHAVTHFG